MAPLLRDLQCDGWHAPPARLKEVTRQAMPSQCHARHHETSTSPLSSEPSCSTLPMRTEPWSSAPSEPGPQHDEEARHPQRQHTEACCTEEHNFTIDQPQIEMEMEMVVEEDEEAPSVLERCCSSPRLSPLQGHLQVGAYGW